MAVPTLISVTPDEFHPGGRQLVRVEGANFELPPAPPATGYVGGSDPVTVEVEVDGRAAEEVKVWSSTLLTFLAPAYRGDPSALASSPGLAVDLTIRNVTGPEEDTFAGAVAYSRPSLARADGPLKHVVRTLLRELRRQVIDNVAMATQVDFDGDTADALDIVELAAIPALALFGPDIQEDRFRRTSQREATSDIPSLTFSKNRVPRVCQLGFEATLTARGAGELQQLTQELIDFFNRNPRLEVDADTADPTAGQRAFDMFLDSGPTRVGTANADDIYSANATFTVHGVPIDADDGTQVEFGYMLDDPPDVDVSMEEF